MVCCIHNPVEYSLCLNKKIDTVVSILNALDGARGRNRTGTVSLPLDFESSASTSFTTRAA